MCLLLYTSFDNMRKESRRSWRSLLPWRTKYDSGSIIYSMMSLIARIPCSTPTIKNTKYTMSQLKVMLIQVSLAPPWRCVSWLSRFGFHLLSVKWYCMVKLVKISYAQLVMMETLPITPKQVNQLPMPFATSGLDLLMYLRFRIYY